MSFKRTKRDICQRLDNMGLEYSFEQGKKHAKLVFYKDNRKRTITVSVSSSDKNIVDIVVKDVERILKGLRD